MVDVEDGKQVEQGVHIGIVECINGCKMRLAGKTRDEMETEGTLTEKSLTFRHGNPCVGQTEAPEVDFQMVL